MNAQKALEYRNPQKVIFKDAPGLGIAPKCPRCGVIFDIRYGLTRFCGNCGQRLDWESLLDGLRDE